MGRSRRAQARLLNHLAELRRTPLGGGPDPAFRSRLRDRLMTAPLEQEEPVSSQAPQLRIRPAARSHRAPRISWFSQLATFGLAVGMMASAFITYQSVPGDTLYPLKRAAESTLVGLSADNEERAARELVSAKERASEVAALLGSSDSGPLVTATLKDMEESTRSAMSMLQRSKHRSSPDISDFAEDQRKTVEPMLEELDQPQQDQANSYLNYIQGLVVPSH
ncbi:DUF5667 domain-containing protein [Nonomuraea sp. NPDC050556]|uniref:DUF5667 domain-containing protein n=1 Tax=Nonomuraea sp. NPDC050556 TaxID=3364369 RepID=UPI0037AFE10C